MLKEDLSLTIKLMRQSRFSYCELTVTTTLVELTRAPLVPVIVNV
jgi:hypothetical protein